MYSPRTVNKEFNTKTFNKKELNFNITQIAKSIDDISKISFKMGASDKHFVRYKKKKYSSEDLSELIKNLKINIKSIIAKENKIKKEEKRVLLENKKNELIEKHKEEFLKKSLNGLESFLYSTNIFNNDKNSFDFFKKLINDRKDIVLDDIFSKNKNYKKKNFFNVETPFSFYDEFFKDFLFKINLGNTFYYLFNKTNNLDGSKKENINEILNFYKEDIQNDIYLSKLDIKLLVIMCNPKIFLLIFKNLGCINFSFLTIILNFYIKINNLRCEDDKRYIVKTPELTFLEENLQRSYEGKEKKIEIPLDIEKLNDRYKKNDLYKLFKSYLCKESEKMRPEKIEKIKNYIFFMKKFIFYKKVFFSSKKNGI